MNISKNKLLHIIFIFITLASLTIMISCSSEEEIVVPKEENEQTVIMFFPWSSNLLPYFQQNIKIWINYRLPWNGMVASNSYKIQ